MEFTVAPFFGIRLNVCHHPCPLDSFACANLPDHTDKQQYREGCNNRRRAGIYVVNPVVRGHASSHYNPTRRSQGMTKVLGEVESNLAQHVRLSEWPSNVCSALAKQTAKSTCGPIGFLNDLASSPRESKWAKRERVPFLIPLSKSAAFASPVMVGG